VKARILKAGYATEDDLKSMDAKIRDTVTASADFATNDPQPDDSELWTDIYKVA
jgi:pyruvate dehydrogenase E1 component alpha subunit